MHPPKSAERARLLLAPTPQILAALLERARILGLAADRFTAQPDDNWALRMLTGSADLTAALGDELLRRRTEERRP